MGCVPSSARPAKEPPEPVPDLTALKSTPVVLIAGEPALTSQHVPQSSDSSTLWNVRQTGAHANGNTLEVSVLNPDDPSADVPADAIVYKIAPTLGFGGHQIHRQMQDMVSVTSHGDGDDKVLCYCIKDIPQGINVFKILKTEPVHAKQPPTRFKGPNDLDLYAYASISFDYDSRVGSIKVGGQGKDDPPLYTVRQCTKEVWVLKKRNVPIVQMTQVKGLMPKFCAWETVAAPQVDPALAACMTCICDWFRVVNNKQMINYYK